MNPYSPEQKYPRSIIKHAQQRCQQEKEITTFLIEHKIDMLARVRDCIDTFDTEFGHEPISLGNGIVLPSPVQIFEEEARHHACTLDYEEDHLKELEDVEKSLENALRRHKQNYDYKYEKFVNSRRQKLKPKNNSAASSSHG